MSNLKYMEGHPDERLSFVVEKLLKNFLLPFTPNDCFSPKGKKEKEDKDDDVQKFIEKVKSA